MIPPPHKIVAVFKFEVHCVNVFHIPPPPPFRSSKAPPGSAPCPSPSKASAASSARTSKYGNRSVRPRSLLFVCMRHRLCNLFWTFPSFCSSFKRKISSGGSRQPAKPVPASFKGASSDSATVPTFDDESSSIRNRRTHGYSA